MIQKDFFQFKLEFIVCILLLTIAVISTIFDSVILTSLLEAIINKSFNAVLCAIVEEIFICTLLLMSKYFQNRVQTDLIRKMRLSPLMIP